MSLTLAGLLGMNEMSRLVGQITSPSTGQQVPLNKLFAPPFVSPGALKDFTTVWSSGSDSEVTERVTSFLAVHTGFDLLFIAGYVLLLLAVLPHGELRWPWDENLQDWWLARLLVWTIAAADLHEDAVAVAVVRDPASWPIESGPASWALTAAGGIKWASVAALLLVVWVTARRTATAKDQVSTGFRATLTGIKWHRYAAVMVALLLVLMTGSGNDVLDQVPDIQRDWFASSYGPSHAAWATLALLGVALGLASLGRLRSLQFSTRGPQSATQPWEYVTPIAVALAVVLLAWFASVTGGANITWIRVAIFAAVIGLPAMISAVIRLLRGSSRIPSRPADRPAVTEAIWVRKVGDALATMVVVVGGLGLIRSFAAPAALAPSGDRARFVVVIVVGTAISVAAWPAAEWLLGKNLPSLLGPRWTTTPPAPPHRIPRLLFLLCMVFALFFLGLLVAPESASGAMGVVAVTVTLLGALVLLLGTWTARLQPTQPLEVFRLLQLRAAPFLSLFVLIGLLTNSFAAVDPQHDVRTLTQGGEGTTPTIASAFTSWAEGEPCIVTTSAGERVRPLILVAAAGGGIRAAEWTVRGLGHLVSQGCGERAVFLSSGVSGGSVGLAVLSGADSVGRTDSTDATRPDGVDAVTAVDRISSPEALGAGMAALLAGDLVAGITGVAIPPHGLDTSQSYDRAALIERSWEGNVEWLRGRFESSPDTPGRAGHLILNSSSAAGLCRVLVSQIRVTGTTTLQGIPPACGSSGIPNTYELNPEGCLPPMSTSTAAMLSARFPYVTPTGVVRFPNATCGAVGNDESWDQLVDGGYAESTGLGTLIDLAPQIMDRVRAWNTDHDVKVVPYVVFLDNGYGTDASVPASDGAPEISAPITGLAAAGRTMSDTRALESRTANAYRDYLPGAGPPADDALGGLVVIAPGSRPQVEAPLGWVLSWKSRQDLIESLTRSFTATEPARLVTLLKTGS